MRELRADRAPHVHLSYSGAGHLVLGPPSVPTPSRERAGPITIDLGGTPAADDAAHRRDWPAMVRFVLDR